mmetsp:Transcript_40378/g.111248  ORF Transcript_40378/g.111248 Transcript_40378/m.111248 type:complete len:529 (+) Transcript_40378:763-2349(+)
MRAGREWNATFRALPSEVNGPHIALQALVDRRKLIEPLHGYVEALVRGLGGALEAGQHAEPLQLAPVPDPGGRRLDLPLLLLRQLLRAPPHLRDAALGVRVEPLEGVLLALSMRRQWTEINAVERLIQFGVCAVFLQFCVQRAEFLFEHFLFLHCLLIRSLQLVVSGRQFRQPVSVTAPIIVFAKPPRFRLPLWLVHVGHASLAQLRLQTFDLVRLLLKLHLVSLRHVRDGLLDVRTRLNLGIRLARGALWRDLRARPANRARLGGLERLLECRIGPLKLALDLQVPRELLAKLFERRIVPHEFLDVPHRPFLTHSSHLDRLGRSIADALPSVCFNPGLLLLGFCILELIDARPPHLSLRRRGLLQFLARGGQLLVPRPHLLSHAIELPLQLPNEVVLVRQLGEEASRLLLGHAARALRLLHLLLLVHREAALRRVGVAALLKHLLRHVRRALVLLHEPSGLLGFCFPFGLPLLGAPPRVGLFSRDDAEFFQLGFQHFEFLLQLVSLPGIALFVFGRLRRPASLCVHV